MTVETIGQDAERFLDWQGLTQAIEAGHRLPKAEIKDIFLYRRDDTLLDRAAWIDGLGSLVKIGTIVPGNTARGVPTINGIVNLFDDVTGELTALIDFHLVTKWKTAGDSLLSASRLARKDSRNILLVGAGVVAQNLVQAYSSIFPEARFTTWSRTRATAEAMGLPVADDLETAV
ncbi:MAG: ornithine cyclodeaminase, partial [Pseudomonadota bacterium]